MSNYTASEIAEAVTANRGENKWGYPRGGWNDLDSGRVGDLPVSLRGETVEIKRVDARLGDYNADGYGADVWMAVQAGTQFFRKEGRYSSEGGHRWDDDIFEVHPVEKTVIEYKAA